MNFICGSLVLLLMDFAPSQHVTVKDIQEAIRKYFLPVFDSATSIGAVTVNSGKAAELEEGFSKLGFEVERRELPQLGAEASDSEGSESGDEGSDSGMEDVRSA